MPERYAVIAVFLKQEPEITFGPPVENVMTKRFKELSQSPVKMKKRFVAEQVGVKEEHLDILSHNLKIEPFWEQRPKTDNPKNTGAACTLQKKNGNMSINRWRARDLQVYPLL